MARFLFPEDDDSIRNLCGLVVAMAGHVLDEARDGIEARDRVHATEYDAIVTDGSMPGGDGPPFLAEVRSLTENRVPCALKSGVSAGELRDWGGRNF